MRDFGDQERLLKSHERQGLWDILLENESLVDSKYKLSYHKAITDNVKLNKPQGEIIFLSK